MNNIEIMAVIIRLLRVLVCVHVISREDAEYVKGNITESQWLENNS